MGGYKFVITKEPDWRRLAKKIIRAETPCTTELVALMDCMRKHGNEAADAQCVRYRAALAVCSQKMAFQSPKPAKQNFVKQLKTVAESWKKYGF